MASDGAGNSSEKVITLDITDLDEVAPTITSASSATALDENSGAGQVVYTVTSTDSGDIATGATLYSLKAVDDAALFTINSTSGAVTLTANPDDESKANYNFTVVATDDAGNGSEKAIALDIIDLDEVAPNITSSSSATALDENSGAGQVVYTVMSTDSADIATGATLYSLKAGDDAALFTINSSTGAVTLTANPDDESKADYSFTVVASDAAGNSSEQAITLDITDLDEVAPTITSLATATAIDENSGAGQVVYTVMSTDNGDIAAGPTVYSLKSGDDAALFTINSNTGAVILTADPDDETKADYNFTVVATDGAGNSSEKAITLDIIDLDEVVLTVTDGNISISGSTGLGGAYKVGDTVLATWNNTAAGDNNAEIISAVAVNFNAFGGGTAVVASNSSGIWTASYTITEDGGGSIDTTNLNVAVTASDNASHSTTTSDTTNATLDNHNPTVTDSNISLSGASGTGGAYKVGDTVLAIWNNTAGGDNNADTISEVAVNFSAFGGGPAVAASNSSGSWTASYTITEDGGGLIDGTNLNVAVTATDDAGNVTIIGDTTNATVDNDSPLLSSSTPTDNGTGVLLTDNIVLNFSDSITLGTGNIVISDGTQTITIDVANHSGQLAISDNTLTINPIVDLANNSANYNVQIAATAIDDTAGNSFAGIADSTTLDFTTTVNTSVVVFDLTDGDSSSHSGRSFDGTTTYTIYIKVATSAAGISVTNPWTGAGNLGSDDTIILVGSGAEPLGETGFPAASKHANASSMAWNNPALVALNKGGGITTFRTGGGTGMADLWSGSWAGTLLQGGTILTTLPNGIATSQGV